MIKRPLLAALLCAGWVMLSPARAATPHQDALYHAIGPYSWVYPLADYIDAAIASAGTGTGSVSSVPNPIVFGVICNVASPTTIPAITCSGPLPVAGGGTGAVTLSGILKGNGTSPFTPAVAGTDYLAPTGSAAALTGLSAALDANFSSTRGSILYRGPSAWLTLGPGTSGNFLETLGAGLDPAWALPSGSGCTFANPTATASDVAVNGVLTTCMRSDAAPAVQKASSSAFGLVKVDNQTIVATAGVISAASPIRTAASPTVITGDMSGTVTISSGGITFPVISAGLFDNKQTLRAANAGGSAAAVTNSTGQTINAGGGCVVASGIPANGYWDMQPNGTTIDCQQAISAAPPTPATAGTNVTLTGPRAYYWCSGTCTVTLPVPVAGYEFCIRNADNVATVITVAALTTSARYEQTARTGYGTAGTGTAVAGGVVTDQICLLGKDATHYDVMSSTGTWTMN